MARQVRVEFSDAVYHVCARGNRRSAIFRTEEDHEQFAQLWGEAVQKTGWRVYAWVLMRNHYHAVFRTPEPNLVEGMRWIQNTWTRRFNVRNGLWGRVFGDRYKSVLCEDGSYLTRLIDYVHLNPVRARLICENGELENFQWSSLRDYVLPARKRRCWLDVSGGIAEMGYTDDVAGRREYLTRLNESVDWEHPKSAGLAHMDGQSLQSTLSRGWYFGAESFREAMLKRVEARLKGAGAAIRRREDGYNGRQCADHGQAKAERIVMSGLQVMNFSEADLAVLAKADPRKALIALAVRRETSVPQKWVRDRLLMGHPSAVSRAVTLAAETVRLDRKMQAAYQQILHNVNNQ